ncbi:ParB/RepB/Spo0J family partition protein [Noviherbaspirillum malthae]|uniref:ParB/RepB/Spo0J family partition protein n=1 Tax=Noviherbaspirillum malthae TaxID=1260987 RepID=UPI001E41E12B|nr:ParB/RepB/Spo0J family partition protein [Noviherbaspirillum malthae]
MKQRLTPQMPLAALKSFNEDVVHPAEKAQLDSHTTVTTEATGPSPLPDREEVRIIPINLIDKSPHQPRMIFDPEAVDALAASIKEAGLMSPISVRQLANGRYELIGGERRMRALESLGRKEITAYVKIGMSDIEAAIGALADNEAKAGLCDYERGKAYQRALSMPDPVDGSPLTQRVLARRIGVSDATISRCLAFFDLPAEGIALLDERPNLIGAKNAASLVKLTKQGHGTIAVQALHRIKDGVSEQGAVNWAIAQVNRLHQTPRPVVPFTLHGVHIADISTDGVKVVITCKNGFSPDDMIARIQTLTEAAE